MSFIRDDDGPGFVLGIMLVVVAVAATLALTSPARVAVKVEGGAFRFAPASLRLRVTVEPHDENRRLTVEADSGSFYRSTDEDLTGKSPRTRWIDAYRDFPAGDYVVTATVRTASGEAYSARDRVEIQGSGAP